MQWSGLIAFEIFRNIMHLDRFLANFSKLFRFSRQHGHNLAHAPNKKTQVFSSLVKSLLYSNIGQS